jgi:2-polyprenyl-3-methyl-5-hydroxy-6-metoxy-1,4-benzoquinol methylase
VNEIWNRLQYMLSPQFDIYESVAKAVRGTVADIGSGTGFGTHMLTRNAVGVDGYELDDSALQFSQRVFTNNKIWFRQGDIVKGIEGQYDFVVMIDVIEHIPNDRKALQNCKALLKNSGILILSTPNRLSRYRKAITHVREYSHAELKTLLKRVFVSVDIRDYKLDAPTSKYSNPIVAVCGNVDR